MLAYRNLIEALEAAPGERLFITFWTEEDTQETVTFGEFRRRSRLQAATLRAQGVEHGDPVVIIMPQGIAAITVFTGTMMLGAVPAFLAYPNEKVEPSKYRAGLAGVTANLKAKQVVIDRDFPDEMLDCVSPSDATILYRADDAIGSAEESNFDVDVPPDQVAFIQHSAGTTGLQKGVALTHAAVLRQLDHLVHSLEIDSDKDRIYSWLPLYHDMGLIACFILPMVCHIPVAMQSPIEWVMQPETMLEVITGQRSTLAWMPNFAFQFIPRRTRGESAIALRSVVSASAHQLLRARAREQYAGISGSILELRFEDGRTAHVVRDG